MLKQSCPYFRHVYADMSKTWTWKRPHMTVDQLMAFSSEDLNYITALGPASLGEGPIVEVQQAPDWACRGWGWTA